MKKMMYLWAMVAFAFASCEKDLEPYSDPTCRINFVYSYTEGELEDNYTTDSYSTTSYSFVYEGNGTDSDTLWFDVGVSGFLKDYPRPIALEQVMVEDTVDNAEAGVHYVAFTDPSVASYYTVPANGNQVSIPVILLRDPSLEQKDVVLRFELVENDYFEVTMPMKSYRTIRITARTVEPLYWSEEHFGKWGQVKHQLMIEWTGEKWDEEYCEEFIYSESAYQQYLSQWMAEKLEEENKKHLEETGDIYREADGTPVDFTPIRQN